MGDRTPAHYRTFPGPHSSRSNRHIWLQPGYLREAAELQECLATPGPRSLRHNRDAVDKLQRAPIKVLTDDVIPVPGNANQCDSTISACDSRAFSIASAPSICNAIGRNSVRGRAVDVEMHRVSRHWNTFLSPEP